MFCTLAGMKNMAKIRNNITKVLGFILVFAVLFPKTHAQTNSLNFDSYTSEDGLSQNSVYSIAQTSDGFMWLGTQDGLNRFDGKEFFHIKSMPLSQDTIASDFSKFSKTITCLYADSADWLWVGTTKEIALYNRYLNKFVYPNVVYNGFNLPNVIYLTKIIEYKNNIWILTKNKGIFCYNKVNKKMVPLEWDGNNPISINAITFAPNGSVWVASEKEIYKLEQNKFSNIKVANNQSKDDGYVDICFVNDELWIIKGDRKIIFLSNFIGNEYTVNHFSQKFKGKTPFAGTNLIHQSDSNTVWLGSRSNGIIKVNLSNHTYENAIHGSPKSVLKTQFVLSFFTNNQKITWVGLSGGLYKFYSMSATIDLFRNETFNENSVSDNKIFSIFTKNDLDFYMGTLYSGLLHFNVTSNTFTNYSPSEKKISSSESKNIYEIIAGKNNLLWLATWSGLLSFDKKTKIFEEFKDKNDEQTIELCALINLKNSSKILTGGYRGGLRIFDSEAKTWVKCYDPYHFLDNTKLRVRYMKEFGEGDIFMSTETSCLVKYNYKSGQFTKYPQFEFISGTSRHFCVDGSFFWIATDDGLIQASLPNFNPIKVWTTKDGLADNYIYAVLTDKFGRIWVSSNQGISMLDYKKNVCRNYNTEDNLQDMEFNTASCYKDKNANLWFGGINGLNKITPELFSPNEYSPSPKITQILVMNAPFISDTSTPYLNKIVLPYNQNFISFRFQSPNYSQSDKTVYQYFLEGVDSGWINNGNRNFVNYTQLKPGKYTFHVKSSNASDVWCHQNTAINIIITPPWWLTWWFYAISILTFIGIVYFLLQYRIKSIRKQEQLKFKIASLEIQSLRSQMNPHFIFNALNSINGFIVENKTHLASNYLTKFSRLIRLILENSKSETISLQKEVETLKLYLLMEGIRFDNKFDYEIFIEEKIDLDYINIAPLIIQPFAENSIWHGLMHKPTKGHLQINILQNDNILVIEIIDNGIGRAKSTELKSKESNKHKSYGMEITTQRILNANPKNSVIISDLIDQTENTIGTNVTISLYI
jgi:ligand-binding sensor domain-containing protein